VTHPYPIWLNKKNVLWHVVQYCLAASYYPLPTPALGDVLPITGAKPRLRFSCKPIHTALTSPIGPFFVVECGIVLVCTILIRVLKLSTKLKRMSSEKYLKIYIIEWAGFICDVLSLN